MLPLLLRRAPVRAATIGASARTFHASTAVRVRVGDRIPDVELTEGSPGNKVNLAKELASGKGVIVGVPAAFSKWSPLFPFLVLESIQPPA